METDCNQNKTHGVSHHTCMYRQTDRVRNRISCSSSLGLLQLATKDAIFLLDMAALPQFAPDAVFIELAERLFASDEVLTLGVLLCVEVVYLWVG